MVEILESRDQLPLLLDFLGLRTGVEIGVAAGEYSELLLRSSHLELLISIDPWSADLPGFESEESAAAAFEQTRKRLNPFGDRSLILQATGVEAPNLLDGHSRIARYRRHPGEAAIPPVRVDFIYIDSSHQYQETKDEIATWWPLVNPGGILAGHDYCNGAEIRQAVHEFVANQGLQLFGTVDDRWPGYRVNSWIIRKPETMS